MIIKLLLEKQFTSYLFLPDSERFDLIKICLDLKASANVDFNSICQHIRSFECLSLEFLWMFHLFQIVPLEEYILHIKGTSKFPDFKNSICLLSIADFAEHESKFFVQTNFLSFVVRNAFIVKFADERYIKLIEACTEILREVLQRLFLIEKEENSYRFSGFLSLWNAGTLEETSLQMMLSYILSFFIGEDFKENNEAFLENFESFANNSMHYEILNKVIKHMNIDKVFDTLKSAICQDETNLRNIFIVLKLFYLNHKDAIGIFSKMLHDLGKIAYETLNDQLLLKIILIGYQISTLSCTASYMCYKKWCQFIFDGSDHLKTPESFSFLFHVLSILVPYMKRSECLKVIIEYPVILSGEGQEAHSDYIALLKTRIKDLKPHINPEESVQKALVYFQETNKIPPFVMESSLLQKQHYLNEFLPSLLVPRIIPPTPDLKERFIEVLYKAGKIPNTLLQSYKEKSFQEEQKVLSDMIVAEDFDDSVDML